MGKRSQPDPSARSDSPDADAPKRPYQANPVVNLQPTLCPRCGTPYVVTEEEARDSRRFPWRSAIICGVRFNSTKILRVSCAECRCRFIIRIGYNSEKPTTPPAPPAKTPSITPVA